MSQSEPNKSSSPLLILALLFIVTILVVAVNEYHMEANVSMVDHYADYDQDLARRIVVLEKKVSQLEARGGTAAVQH